VLAADVVAAVTLVTVAAEVDDDVSVVVAKLELVFRPVQT
jgi:hypothetical protein